MNALDQRRAMIAKGYHPVPVLTGTKWPVMDDWPDLAANATADSVTTWPADHGSTGILCGAVRGVDIDVLDARVAGKIEALAMEAFNMSPLRRVGQAPKVLLLYRAADPTAGKVTSASFTSPGYLKHGTDKLAKMRVEVLGDGQQAVCFGLHPDTGRGYAWAGVSPEDIPLDTLPVVSEAQIEAFLLEAEAVMTAARWTRVAAGGKGATARVGETPAAALARVAAPSVKAVVDLLNELPNPAEVDREGYVQIMFAARGAQQGLAAAGIEDDADAIGEAAAGWAERHADYDGTDERERWASDFSQGNAPLAGWPTLQAWAGRLIPGHAAEVAAGEFRQAPLPPVPPGRRRVIAPGQCEGVTSRPYRVKGLLAERDVGCLFGPPGAGKSLLAPLMAYRLAQGEPFFGLRTRPGPALYVAAEDESGMERRVSALRLAHGDAPGFGLVEGVADLLNPSSGDLAWLLAEVAERKPALIVIDTLAMAFPGLIENDADGMGRVVAVARQLTEHGAAVLLVHHDSKARDGTPRGHSLLNGALDVAIALDPKDGDGVVRARLTKNRNGSCEHNMAFHIGVRVLGTDGDGDPVTAAVAVELSGWDAAVQPPAKLSGGQAAALGALVRCMATDAATAEDGAPAVPEEAWMAACITLSPAATPKDRARSARRMRGELVDKGAVHAVGAMFRPATPARGASHGGTEGGRMQTTDFIEGDEGGRKRDEGTPSPGDGGTEGTGSYRTRPPVPPQTPLANLEAVAELVGVAA